MKDDGGPAFGHGNPCDGGHTGMCLRDWFAGLAMQGLIASNDDGAGDRIDEVPEYAYQIADAMIVEREAARKDQDDE